MSWDPITRIVGSLGIHTEIDFTNQQVIKCYSTSMVFRGFDIFMKGIDPRDAHFITSRICGICGDNHCTCSCLNQNMAYGSSRRSSATTPTTSPSRRTTCSTTRSSTTAWQRGLLRADGQGDQPDAAAKAEKTAAPHGDIHGYKTIADIMRALNPFTGELLPRDAAGGALHARDVLPVRRPPHAPVDDHAGRRAARDITHQTCTDYYVRLMRYIDYVKRTRADARRPLRLLPAGAAGLRHGRLPRHDLVCWGCFDDPDYVDYDYRNMTEWGRTATSRRASCSRAS
jgi:hydrogenase large subunit